MASGTFNDALVNPHDGNRGSYQYPPDSGMDYTEDLPDLNGDEEDYYEQGTGYEDQYGPGVDGVGQDTEGYQDNEFAPVGGTGGETEGYGEADLPDLDGEQEGYDEGLGPEDGEYEPQNDGADEDFEESEGEDSEDEEEGEEEEEEKDGEDDDFDALGGLDDLLGEEGPGLVPGSSRETENNTDVPMTDPGEAQKMQDDKPPEEGQKKKRKRRKKDEIATGEKPKRKRKKKEKVEGDGEDSEKKKQDKFARRNIRKIIGETSLEKDTLDAQAAELERQKRLAEIKKSMLLKQQKEERERKAAKPEKDSQLKSLLQAAEEEAEDSVVSAEKKAEEKKDSTGKPVKKDAIEISSGEEEEDSDVVMLKSDEDDDDEEDYDDEEDAAEAEDVNNSGSHINDKCNLKEKDGSVLINLSHPTADPDIYLPKNIADHIKPHQIGGVRFLYDNLIECINRFKTSNGFGCILAHSMGLGKTIQVVGFTDIFLKHTGAKSVLIIVPINTLANWMAEFNMWVPDQATLDQHGYEGDEIKPRPYDIYLLNDNYKTTPARSKVVEKWQKSGGVLLMGYEMYRLLSSKKVHLQKPKSRKKTPGSDVIDVEEVDRDKNLLVGVHSALVNPGPDLVVCDEGHRIKNCHAGISQSLKNIKTKRRIVLTGYPLQNNLIEYWCMVDFVRPNFLGTKTEFCNMFERPIMNGQCADSTPQDVRLMRYRSHVLHSLLEGFVQRRGHTVLKEALLPKEEYVFMVQMSDIQKQLYKKFMDSVADAAQNGWVNNNPLKAFSVCCKIWNHPDILYNVMKKATADDNDLDLGDPETKKKGARGKTKVAATAPMPGQSSSGPQSVPGSLPLPVPPSSRPSEPNITYDWVRSKETVSYDWAADIMKDYQPGLLEHGGKFVILFNLIQESLAMEDKILVFSQSLFTLNLIEDFLSREKVPRWDMDEYWCKNKNYFRLDGSTSSTEREKMINTFNQDDNYQHWVFLLSTRAGSLGVNLIGANRVIVMDASWNPCHDCQAICRVYRFGQMKHTFIYRFVTENTMERKIYDRQINKQGMSDRVVDELNPQNQFKKEQVENILVYNEKEYPVLDFSSCEDDYPDIAMVHVLINEGKWLTAKPFTHESLLIDRKELKLTMKEKRLAKQSYVMEKRLNVSYSRPSYSQFYPKNAQQPYQGMIRGRPIARPIASVKPMISTPVPMKPKIISAPQVLKPGVSVHQVLTTTEIVLPGTNTTTEAGKSEPKKIPSGQQVLVIRTPKGVYIRTPDGKIFAVRSKPQTNSSSPLDKLANTGSNLNPAGGGAVTVIRPNLSGSRPMAVVQKDGATVKMVVPISTPAMTQGKSTISMATGTTAPTTTATAVLKTVYAQSPKVNSLLQSGAQIRIVTPNVDPKTSVAPLSALQTLTTATKIVSSGPNFSGGNLITKKILPKQVASVQLIKKTVGQETKTNSSISANSKDNTKTTDSGSWNLKPINVSAIKNPLQQHMDSVSGQPVTNIDSSKVPGSQTGSKEPEQNIRPTFDLGDNLSESSSSNSQSPKPFTPPLSQGPIPSQVKGSSSLPMRPSDIDLHELQLSGESKAMSQRPSDIDLSAMKLSTTKKETEKKKPRARSTKASKASKSTKAPSSQNNLENLLSSPQGTSQNIGNLPQNIAGAQNKFQSQSQNQFQQGMLPSNQYPGGTGSHSNMQSGFTGGVGSSEGTQNMGNANMTNTMGAQGMDTGSQGSMEARSGGTPGGFMRMMSGEDSQDDDSLLAEFNSNIQNNSSFLSELNLTEADQNFMSQHVFDNNPSNMNQMNMSSNYNNNMGMSGYNSGGNMGYQQPGMNYDSGGMYNNPQNTGYNYPSFGAGPYQGNSYSGNQSSSQRMPHSNSYPGSMYPMPGMMQPGMYGYPPYPYPYPPHMMPPMPYYPPMPMPPQYGQPGQGGSNMSQMNMTMSGDNQMSSGTTGPNSTANNNTL